MEQQQRGQQFALSSLPAVSWKNEQTKNGRRIDDEETDGRRRNSQLVRLASVSSFIFSLVARLEPPLGSLRIDTVPVFRESPYSVKHHHGNQQEESTTASREEGKADTG